MNEDVPFEDVVPIEYGDIPASHVSLPGGKMIMNPLPLLYSVLMAWFDRTSTIRPLKYFS